MKLLPLLCLLSPWFGPSSAQESSDVVTVAEDDDALLKCSLGSKIEKFDWVKDKEVLNKRKDVFMVTDSSHDSNSQDPQFQGRVSFFKDELKAGNASIKIKRTRLEDSGIYTCVLFDRPDIHIRLNVGAAREPHVSHVNETLLKCQVWRAYPKPDVVWQDSSGKNISSQGPQFTKRGDSYDVLLFTTVTRNDHYRCVVTQKEIKHQVFSQTYANTNEPHNSSDNTGWIFAVVLLSLVIFGLI